MKENGQSSSHDDRLCPICVDSKPAREFFSNGSYSCSHSFCNDCVGKYIATKIHENIPKVECPDPECRCLLQPQLCRSILPKHVFDRWQIVISEALLLGQHKLFYCPFKDCSALFVLDDAKQAVTVAAECQKCHRGFCFKCKVPWHNGLNCREFKKLGKDERGAEDLKLMELARKNKWRRCPSCKIYVERKSGCTRVTCRCRCVFCYACGLRWDHVFHSCGSPVDSALICRLVSFSLFVIMLSIAIIYTCVKKIM